MSKSSGLTTQATTDNEDIIILDLADSQEVFHDLVIHTSGNAPGFVSFDADAEGNRVWHYVPAAVNGISWQLRAPHLDFRQMSIRFKRVYGGTNVTGIFVSVW